VERDANWSMQIRQPTSGFLLISSSRAVIRCSIAEAVCGIHPRKIAMRLFSGLFAQLSSILSLLSFANITTTRLSNWEFQARTSSDHNKPVLGQKPNMPDLTEPIRA